MQLINLNDNQSKGTYWASLFIDESTAVYFDSFEIEYISKKVLNKIKKTSITRRIFRIQFDEYIMYGFYCTAFIEYIFA